MLIQNLTNFGTVFRTPFEYWTSDKIGQWKVRYSGVRYSDVRYSDPQCNWVLLTQTITELLCLVIKHSPRCILKVWANSIYIVCSIF